MLTDTHSHLYDEAFDADRDAVLERARAAGIGKIFLPNINAETIQPMLRMAQQHPGFLYPMLGLHPEDLGTNWRDVLTQMERLLQQAEHPFIAIGEVGLDYYWDRSLYEEQQQAFAIQVRWAMKYNLPLMIHTRSAHREMIANLKSANREWEGQIVKGECASNQMTNGECRSNQIVNCKSSNCKLTGVFHCFGGTAEEAVELLDFEGFCLGIGGALTYKRSQLPEVLHTAVPLSRIVIETDAPYLAAVPYRGKRNEPAFITEVARRLAEIYDTSVEEVTKITTQNALRTFPKAQ